MKEIKVGDSVLITGDVVDGMAHMHFLIIGLIGKVIKRYPDRDNNGLYEIRGKHKDGNIANQTIYGDNLKLIIKPLKRKMKRKYSLIETVKTKPMKTLNIIIIILAIAIICGIVSMIRLTQDLNKAEFKLSEQPKYKELYKLSKQTVKDYQDSLRSSDSIVNYHVEFDKKKALKK